MRLPVVKKVMAPDDMPAVEVQHVEINPQKCRNAPGIQCQGAGLGARQDILDGGGGGGEDEDHLQRRAGWVRGNQVGCKLPGVSLTRQQEMDRKFAKAIDVRTRTTHGRNETERKKPVTPKVDFAPQITTLG